MAVLDSAVAVVGPEWAWALQVHLSGENPYEMTSAFSVLSQCPSITWEKINMEKINDRFDPDYHY